MQICCELSRVHSAFSHTLDFGPHRDMQMLVRNRKYKNNSLYWKIHISEEESRIPLMSRMRVRSQHRDTWNAKAAMSTTVDICGMDLELSRHFEHWCLFKSLVTSSICTISPRIVVEMHSKYLLWWRTKRGYDTRRCLIWIAIYALCSAIFTSLTSALKHRSRCFQWCCTHGSICMKTQFLPTKIKNGDSAIRAGSRMAWLSASHLPKHTTVQTNVRTRKNWVSGGL